MASSDKYRSYLNPEENKDTKWRFGAAPNYEVVDELFEQGRTKVWPPGSVEEMVQNLVKTWEMELFHKSSIDDYKSIDPYKFTYSINGRKPLSLEEIGQLGGGYNPHLQTSLPDQYQIYNPSQEDANTSHILFTTTFPRGFALEVLQLYSGPPSIVFKFRHWGYMEGPFKTYAPTGELIEFFGMAILELDESKRIVKVEFFYDRGELLGKLVKGATLDGIGDAEAASGCPFLKNTGSMASSGDKYRTYLYGEGEKNTKWRYGAPPNYDIVDHLFEVGRTKIWPAGSVEEQVQNLVKTWEMEMFHKTCFDDYKSVDPNNYTFSLNGRKAVTLEEKRKLGGGYNNLLQTSLPEKFRCYNPAEETVDSAHQAFTTAFPRGFALEILHVYSGPPVIVYKFRHWAYMEGPFKGHASTGELVEFFGMSIFQLNEQMKITKVEFFYDRGELLGALMKGEALDGLAEESASSCPFLRNTG